MKHYYNEFDKHAAAWLRELMKAGLIPQGDVDERSIREVQPEDLVGYVQCHFFAGIGGWPLALRHAGWPEDRECWTGSCPCQPFSAAGKRKGTADDRHLWPEFQRLIAKRRPAICFGEQVASADGRKWLGGVRLDLEALDYAVGAADLCAAGAGEEAQGWILRGNLLGRERIVLSAPHIRQRIWWLADSDGGFAGDGHLQPGGKHRQQLENSVACGVADAGQRAAWRETVTGGVPSADRGKGGGQAAGEPPGHCLAGDGWVGHSDGDGWRQGGLPSPDGASAGRERPATLGGDGGAAGFWSAFDVLPCRDGKARRVESGTFPLAHGIPGRVGLLRGYGNAINPYVAAEFIGAYLEVKEGM